MDTCFMNPGTSEIHFVSALDSVKEMHSVLCLFEGVATGCADGYARVTGKPAAALLHLGPGLGNGIANLHNAKKAYTPMVNLVGQHATSHLAYDAPLSTDIEGLARPVSHWVRTTPKCPNRGGGCGRSYPGRQNPAGANCHAHPSVRRQLGSGRRSREYAIAPPTLSRTSGTNRRGGPTAPAAGKYRPSHGGPGNAR